MGAGSPRFACGLVCTKDSGNLHDFSTDEPTVNMFVLGFSALVSPSGCYTGNYQTGRNKCGAVCGSRISH